MPGLRAACYNANLSLRSEPKNREILSISILPLSFLSFESATRSHHRSRNLQIQFLTIDSNHLSSFHKVTEDSLRRSQFQVSA
ncbi:hypothetical protein WN55_03574 [Dufourea novaeangliae]|uniref:Uncharacterized protein n=1 Tax=Dufourea novaeangliae TaxID=178035 RepID=A0A154PJR9_DUFNO|nr:hypothetical protein WN55_03574 [Dufourea novaeangliae]